MLQSRFEPPISGLHTKPNLTASETMKVRQWKVGGDGGRRREAVEGRMGGGESMEGRRIGGER